VAGSESTELVWADNQTELTGKLEAAGDVDTFRATAPQSGEVTLELDELEEDKRLNLNVTVTNAGGEVIAEGSTNEFLRITFDAAESDEFFVAVSGGQGQNGDYRFTLNLEPSAAAIQGDDVVVDEVLESESPVVDANPIEDVVADTADEVTAEEEVAVEADDATSDLVEAVTGDTVADELEGDVAEGTVVDEIEDEAGLIVEEPTGELVDDEVASVVDQVEDVLGEVSDDVTAIVDVIGDEISEVEEITAIEDVLDEVSDDVTAIVDVIGDEISQIDGISEIADEVGEILEDGLAETPVDEIEEAVDQVVGELEELLGQEPEVVEVDEVAAGQIVADATQVEVVAEETAELGEVVAIEEVETVEDSIAQIADAEAITDELVGDLVVAPTEGAAESDSDLEAEVVQEVADLVDQEGESQLADENVVAETEDEDDRELVWSFGPDSIDSFFESLNEARDEFHNDRGRRFGGWGRRLWRALHRI